MDHKVLVKNQYKIPSRLEYLAFHYDISWKNAIMLYTNCVDEVIIASNAKDLYDTSANLGFGRGLVLAEKIVCKKIRIIFFK